MDVIFNFPNGSTFNTDMGVVPRVGDLVDLLQVNSHFFDKEIDWLNFQQLKSFTWEVDKVVWLPLSSSYGLPASYVNLILKRVDKPTN
jgi:hypothetical protein